MPGSHSSRLAIGAYTLLLAFMAGAGFMDFLYASALRRGVDDVFREIADALLFLAMPVILAGLASIALAAGRVRVLAILSLAVYALSFLLPALAGLLPAVGTAMQSTGPFLRGAIALGALAPAALAQRETAR